MPPLDGNIAESRILDVLSGIRDTLDEVKSTVIRLTITQDGHATSMREQGARLGDVEQRLKALETIHSEERGALLARAGLPTMDHRVGELERLREQADGAGRLAKVMWLVVPAAAALLAWLASHPAVHP